MPHEPKGLTKFGGAALIGSGVSFLVVAVLAHMAGSPPSTGVDIVAWSASERVILAFANEALFVAALLLVPAVVALYQSLATDERTRAATGCGIIAVVIPVIAVLDIVHGRLVYPVYGIHADRPDVAELVVAVFYGGMHAVGILLGVATIVLSLAMRRTYGMPIAVLGFVTGALDFVGAYPYLIGPVPTLVCQVFFAAWFVAVGWRLYGMDPLPSSRPQGAVGVGLK